MQIASIRNISDVEVSLQEFFGVDPDAGAGRLDQ
jgi:hypothetical protein